MGQGGLVRRKEVGDHVAFAKATLWLEVAFKGTLEVTSESKRVFEY